MTRSQFLRGLILGVVCLPATLNAADVKNSSDAFYSTIRANDLAGLAAMLKAGADPNLKEERGGLTPLMYAAEVGSTDAMRMLLDNGANPNLKNDSDSTALMWSVSDAAKVRLLLEHHADVNTATKRGRTAILLASLTDRSAEIMRLLIAAGADIKAVDGTKMTVLHGATLGSDTETIKLAIDAGLDVNAADFAGFTPLMNAAMAGNVAAAKLLIAKGANVNAVSGDGSFQKVKAGTIALGNWTPLLAAAAYGSPDLVAALLEAGANVNACDVRGMTPLMLAIATDRQSRDVVRALITRRADVNIKSLAGETALDWALKIGAPAAIDLLKRAGAVESRHSAAPAMAFAPVDLRPSVERSVKLLETTSVRFAAAGGCASCHSHNILDVTGAAAKRKGVALDEKAAADRYQLTKVPFFSASNLMERFDGPGAPDIAFYALAGFANAKYPADRTTDAMVANTAAQQRADGSWTFGGVARPPIEDGHITRTALGIRALKSYGPPGRNVEFGQRVSKAAAWLAAVKPVTAQDRNMQLLGLQWAQAETATQKKIAAGILAIQRADGGWSQTPDLKSDAYATGQSLFALAEAGMLAPSDPAYQKGIKFLLGTQLGDGSWYVRSRSPKFQPYFESGFPYGHDQWISAMATGWATTALALAIN